MVLARLGSALVGLLVVASCGGPEAAGEQPELIPGPSPFVYPIELWDLQIEGEATLMVRVSEVGAVDSVYVLESSGFAEFDDAARAGARSLRFSPGRQGDRRVAMWTRLPVRFALDTVPGVGLAAPPLGDTR
jgi:TonB family protein